MRTCLPARVVRALILSCVLAALAPAASAEIPVDKRAVLRHLAEAVVAPAYADLASRSTELRDEVARFSDTSTQASLAAARERWVETALAARRLAAFRAGPLTELGAEPTFFFYAIRTENIEKNIRSLQPLDAEKIADLGAATKGIAALEYLLFAPSLEAAELALSGAGGERRRAYMRLLAEEQADQAARVAQAWADPATPSVKFFVESDQAGLNLLVNEINWVVEIDTAQQLFPLTMPAPGLPTLGTRSGQVTRLIYADFIGVQCLYSGNNGLGIDDWLRRLASPVADRLDTKFAEMISRLQRLDRPLLEARNLARDARIAHACAVEMERMLKLEFTAALGATLTFSPIDGD